MVKISNKKKILPNAKIYVSKPMSLNIKDPDRFHRADLEFHGLEHFGPSYEARIFLNNPNANKSTPKTEKTGYAGSLHVFAHGGQCYGGPGHCQVRPIAGPYDLRSAHPLTPITKTVNITKQLKRIIKKTRKITVAVVPIARSYNEMADLENLLKFQKLSLVTYDN